ncbi:LysM peptidoglycan-binding domain-containing protein [Ligilactobacillus salivarius]|uniref:LysM peptidoglycan-binding domain-containing protein n=1 Tax=Ligilactobacillus salivarius TaxID=1624 RepID=UPI001CBF24AC|nr:LysM peptidoglycan-binding domain-containing protein [Ligilactobacillus salivarius]
MEKLYKALTEQKYRVKLIKKGNHWVARGMTILLFGLGVIALSNVEVQASSWHANSPAEIAKRISSNDRTFTFERGDTFWGISQVLNINYQTLMEWNGYKSGDEYTIPVGTVISIRGNRLTFTTPNGNVILDKIIQPQDRITQTPLPTPAIITNKQKADNSSDNSNNSGSDSNREFPTDKGNVDSGNNGNNTDNSGNDSSNIPTDNGNVDTGNNGNNNTNNLGSDNSNIPTDNGNVDNGNSGNNNTNNSGSDSSNIPTDNGNVDTGNNGNNNTNNSGSDNSNIPTDNGNVDTGNSDNNANNSGSDNNQELPTDNGNVDAGNNGNNNTNNSGSDNNNIPTDNGNVDTGNNGNNNTNNSGSDNSNIPTDNGNVDNGNSGNNNANNSGSDNSQEFPTDNGNVDAGNNGNNNTNNSGSDNSNIPTDNGNVDNGNSGNNNANNSGSDNSNIPTDNSNVDTGNSGNNNANNSGSDNSQELPTDNGNVDTGNNGNNNTNNSGSDNNQELPTDNGNVDAGNNGNNNTNNSGSDNSNIPTDNGNVDNGNSGNNNANNSGSDNSQELPTDNGNVDAGNNGNNNTNNSGSDNSNIPTDNGNVDNGNSGNNNANNSGSDNSNIPTDNGNVDNGNSGNNNANNSGNDNNQELPTDNGNVDVGNNGNNNTNNSGSDNSQELPTDNDNVDNENSGNNNANNSGSDNSQELPTDNGNVDAGNNGNNNTNNSDSDNSNIPTDNGNVDTGNSDNNANNSGSDNNQELPTDNGNVNTDNNGNNNTNNSGSDNSNIPTDNGNVDTGNNGNNNTNNSGSDNSNIPTDNGNVDTGNSGNNNNNNSSSDNSQELPTDNGNVDNGNSGNNNANNSGSDNNQELPTDNGNVDTGNSGNNNTNNSGSDSSNIPTDNGNVDAGNNGNNNTNNSGSDNSNIPTDNSNVDTGNSGNNNTNNSGSDNSNIPTDNGNIDNGNSDNNTTNNSGSDNNGGPSSIDEVSPSKPEQPKIDISPLQNLLMANSNIVSLPIYYNASENNRLAFDALMSEAKSLQYKLSLTNEEMVAMIDKLTAAKNNLNGKATDFSKADELLEEYNNRDNNQRYHNATASSQLAYDNAINELKKLQNTIQVTQATVDSAIANVIEAKNQLDGKVLSTEEQNKFDAIKSFKEDIAYYQEAIKYLPDAYRTAAEGLLQAQGLNVLSNINAFSTESIVSMQNNLKTWLDFYIKSADKQLQGKRDLEAKIQELQNLVDTKLSLYTELNRATDFINASKEMLQDPSKAYLYEEQATKLTTVINEAIEAQNKADKLIADKEKERAAALEELLKLQVPGKDSYIKFTDENYKITASLDDIVERTKLVAKILPYLGDVYAGNPIDPEYLKYKTVDEYLQVGTPAYDKMVTTINRLKEDILKEFALGRGSKDSMGSNIDKRIKTVVTDEDVINLKPLIDLADAYSKRALENINRMRFAIGVPPMKMAPISDKRKAMMIVHALAGYQAGQNPDFKIGDSHVGTIAVLLVPHAMTAGYSENVYPSANAPIISNHFTPEYMADVYNKLELMEGIKYFSDYFNDTEAKSGHYTNIILPQHQYFYSAMIVGNVVPENNSFSSYRVSLTELFYELADNQYKWWLKHFDEWPKVNPETDLDRTDFNNL